MGLGPYDSLGEYCGPYTASPVFLIIIFMTSSFTALKLYDSKS